MLGVPTLEVDRTLRLGIAGLEAGKLREADGDEPATSVVRLAGERAGAARRWRRSTGSTSASDRARLMPLAQVARRRLRGHAARDLRTTTRERAVTVTQLRARPATTPTA